MAVRTAPRSRSGPSDVRGVRTDPPSPSPTGGHPGSHGDLGGTRARKERRPGTGYAVGRAGAGWRPSMVPPRRNGVRREVTTLVDLFGPDAGDCWFAVWSGFARPPTRAAYLLAGGSLRQRAASAMIRVRERSAAARARMSARRLSTFPVVERRALVHPLSGVPSKKRSASTASSSSIRRHSGGQRTVLGSFIRRSMPRARTWGVP